MHGGDEKEYKITVKEPDGKRPCEGSRCRYENSSKVKLKATGCEDIDWVHLVEAWVQCDMPL
jgi:hypothetical protein